MLLADLGLKNYDDVKKQRNRVDMTNIRAEKFLNKIIEQATHKRRQLNGVKTQNILLHKKGSGIRKRNGGSVIGKRVTPENHNTDWGVL